MKKATDTVQDHDERRSRRVQAVITRLTLHTRLDELQVPVGEVAPHEVIEAIGHLVEPEALQILGDVGHGPL